jgi:hypothetical protein
MLLPSPRTSDTNGAGHHGDGGMDLRTAVAEIPLLPTPATKEPGGTPEQYHARLAAHDGRESHFLPLSMAVQLLPTPTRRDYKDTECRREPHRPDDVDTLARVFAPLLPTPRATDGTKGGPNQRGSSGDLMLPSAVNLLPTPTAMDSRGSGGNPDTTGTHGTTLTDATVRQPARWGEYEPAIRRHEIAFGRPAPEPTKLNSKGNPKLSDEFDEWLMGYPKGWITDVPGVTWNEALKACGNGVVPQQGAAALRFLLDHLARAAA